MKKSLIFVSLFLLLIFIISFVSALSFSDLWGKITGEVADTQTCVDSDVTTDYPDGVNPFTKGVCSGGGGFTIEDSCMTAGGSGPVESGAYVKEAHCLTDEMIEYCKQFNSVDYCDNLLRECYSAILAPWSAYTYFEKNESFFCPNGCFDGSCVEGDGVCVPDCTGKQCGGDGCGGTCGGACGTGEECDGFGQCVSACTPGELCYLINSCRDNTCIGQTCTDELGNIYPGNVVPDCTGKWCGDDGCGGSCGTCNDEEECVGNVCQISQSAQNQPPNVTDVQINPNEVFLGRLFTITANITDPDGIAVAGSGIEPPIVEESTLYGSSEFLLFDDGAHGDGDAGDGIYGNILDSTGYPKGIHNISIRVADTLGNSKRYENIAQYVILDNPPPNVTDIKVNPNNIPIGTLIITTANITDTDGIAVAGSGMEPPILEMTDPSGRNGETVLFDDGAHGDGNAGDGIYGSVWDSTNAVLGDYNLSIRVTDRLGNSKKYENIAQIKFLASACVSVINNGPSSTKIDVVFVGSGFQTLEDFYWIVDEFIDYNGEIDGLLSVEPFKSNREKFNFWIDTNLHNFSDDHNDANYWAWNWRKRARESCSFGDELILLSVSPEIWPVSSGGTTTEGIQEGSHQLQMSIGSQYLTDTGWPLYVYGRFLSHDKVSLRKTLIHEFGHAFGGLYDEYVYGNPPSTVDPVGYNCATVNCDKWCTGVFEDTGPSEEECNLRTNSFDCYDNGSGVCVWTQVGSEFLCKKYRYLSDDVSSGLTCIEDTGCFKGCSFSNWYRAYSNTVMRYSGGTKEYGIINENRLQEVLNRYA